MSIKRKEYIATNVKTGEKIQGTISELAIAVDSTVKSLYQIINKPTYLFRKTWKFRIADDSEDGSDGIRSKKLWKEWDRVTEPFKKLSNSRKNKLRKPY